MIVHLERAAEYDDIIALPEHITGEIVFGNLCVSRRGLAPFCVAATRLTWTIGAPYFEALETADHWTVLNKPGIHLGENVVVPDVAGWRTRRLAGKWDRPWFDEAPDWVFEVALPDMMETHIEPKRRVYALFGVNHLWHANPIQRLFEAYTRQGGEWISTQRASGFQEISAAPFDHIRLPLKRLWQTDPV